MRNALKIALLPILLTPTLLFTPLLVALGMATPDAAALASLLGFIYGCVLGVWWFVKVWEA